MAYTYGASGDVYGAQYGVYAALGGIKDTGTGTETSTTIHRGTDSGHGTDASTLKVTHSRSDTTGHGTDASAFKTSITATQTSVSVDYVIVEMHIQEEFATAVDSSDVAVTFDVNGLDSGSGTDSGSVSTTGGGTPVSGTDSGHGTDSSTARRIIRAFDTGTGNISSLSGGGGNYFGGIYFGEYASGTATLIDGETSTLRVSVSRSELGLALDSSVPIPRPPSPTDVPGIIVLRGTLRFRMGEGVLAYA